MTRFLLRRELISTILNQGNTILHYRNYMYNLNLLFFGRCSPNGELYRRIPEPVGDWRGQGGAWPQDVVPVNEQNCNSRTSGSRFVHCPRSFHLFFPPSTYVLLHDQFCKLSSVLMKMLSFLPLCVIYLCTYPHEIRRQMSDFSFIYTEKDRDPMDVLRISTRIVRKKFGISESVIQIEEYHPTMSECNECQDPPD